MFAAAQGARKGGWWRTLRRRIQSQLGGTPD
jgi:hypothetical protein